jgi:hypothetical protein
MKSVAGGRNRSVWIKPTAAVSDTTSGGNRGDDRHPKNVPIRWSFLSRSQPLALGKLTKRFPRLKPATATPDDELGHIQPATSDLATMDPPLAFADAIREFTLRQSRLLSQLS